MSDYDKLIKEYNEYKNLVNVDVEDFELFDLYDQIKDELEMLDNFYEEKTIY